MSDPGIEAMSFDAGAAQPAGNASRDDWAAYAISQGATEEVLNGMSRNEIRDQYSS